MRFPVPVDRQLVSLIADMSRRLKLVEHRVNDPAEIGGVLARSQIQSTNYTPLTAGWAIRSDGTCDFNQISNWYMNGGWLENVSIASSSVTSSAIADGTITESTITFDAVGGLLLVYATTTSSTTFTSGQGLWTAPAGLLNSSVKVECWGAGAGGFNASFTDSLPPWKLPGNAGGGGGEYAAEQSVAVTVGNSYPWNVGSGGSAGTSSAFPGPGSDSFFTGDSGTVTAHGGGGGSASLPSPQVHVGGRGSTNTVHQNGGDGGTGVATAARGGAGGGGGGGPQGSGGSGGTTVTTSGAAGGTGNSGGGNGGGGGAGTGASGTAGSAGAVFGGGGGGGGNGTTGFADGGAGGAGRVKLTWLTGQTLIGAIAPAAGTDAAGNHYPMQMSGIASNGDWVALGQADAKLWFGASGGSGTESLARNTSSGGLQTSGDLRVAGKLFGSSGTLAAGDPIAAVVSGSTETWHTMTLLNSWGNGSAGNVKAAYKKVASPDSCVMLVGTVRHTSATSAVFAQLPAGYRPVSQQFFAVGCSGASPTSPPFLSCDTSGNLSINNAPAGAGDYIFSGLISLDAAAI